MFVSVLYRSDAETDAPVDTESLGRNDAHVCRTPYAAVLSAVDAWTIWGFTRSARATAWSSVIVSVGVCASTPPGRSTPSAARRTDRPNHVSWNPICRSSHSIRTPRPSP